MTATKTTDRDFDVQVLEDSVRGHFAGKNALMGSVLASQGAIVVNDSLTGQGDWIGNEVTVPYFGVLGDFEDNPEDTAVTPKVLKSTSEKAVLGRSSLAFEVTRWARHSGPMDVDPYEEASRQVEMAAIREMDRLCLAAAVNSPLKVDNFSASSPSYLNWDMIVDGRAKFGDEDADIVGMATHSRALADLRKLRDSNGKPLLVESMRQGEVTTFCGIPVVVSDRVSLAGSSMGSVTEAGASVGGVTLTGTPMGAYDLRIDIITGGARGTATFKFSTDGGVTWSAELTTAATVPLIDTAADSLVGENGKTGITAAFATATYNAASVYSSKAILKVATKLIQRASLVFWYNRNAMGLETDKDILKDNDVAAMHMYRVAHLYRRRNGGRRPGVVNLFHNVRTYDGS